MSRAVLALLTDSNLRAVVAGLRGLGRTGVKTIALGPVAASAGNWSRHARHRLQGPDVVRNRRGFLGAVRRALEEHGPAVVYPGQEHSLDALMRAWDGSFEKGVLPFPGPGAVQRVRDKRALALRARDAGLAAVPTAAEGTAGDLLSRKLPVPCAVKPPMNSPALPGTKLVRSRPELDGLLSSLPAGEQLIVQPVASGAKTSVCLVLDRNADVVAAAQHETMRSYPLGAGSSALARSVPVDAELVRRVGELLATAGYWGLAEVELIRTDDGLAPIDVNPRFYGTLPLTLSSGVNLPAFWHAVATGDELPERQPYRSGITYRWLEADVLGAMKGRRELLLDAGDRPRVGAMWDSDDVVASSLLAAGAGWKRLRTQLGRG